MIRKRMLGLCNLFTSLMFVTFGNLNSNIDLYSLFGPSLPSSSGGAFRYKSKPTSNVVLAVDHNKFRKCDQTGFCRLFRRMDKSLLPSYTIDTVSIESKPEEGLFVADLVIPEDRYLGHVSANKKPLHLKISTFENGASRIHISEKKPIHHRWESEDILVGLEEGKQNVYDYEVLPTVSKTPYVMTENDDAWYIKYGRFNTILKIWKATFKIDLFRENETVPAITLNDKEKMHFEHYRFKEAEKHSTDHNKSAQDEKNSEDRHKGKTIVGYWEDGLARYSDGTTEEKIVVSDDKDLNEKIEGDLELWEETFSNFHDTKPYGPSSVGIDISFPLSAKLYGIPEHASSFALQTTTGKNEFAYKEPYRLYSLDVFEYELNQPMALYGNIPVMYGIRKMEAKNTGGTSQPKEKATIAGIYYNNPTETFIDVDNDDSSTHWISESGNLDVFLLPGDKPRQVAKQFTDFVGTQALPPMFSLGFHQCRWNYRDEKDVATVHEKFEELDIPYDVLWLDIEHTDGKRYFTWDKRAFPTPTKMLDKLSDQGRKMVTIVDPHLKRDNNYRIHKEATQKNLYIKDRNGNDFDGFCWPGASSYLDFTAKHVRDWWANQFALDKYTGSTMDLYTWNDMNEPSVFNGPEVSMDKDCKNLQGIEHRQWHNLYGFYMQMATQHGLVIRDKPKANKRPFVLSRSFFAGSQRFGAIWTGDNKADWSHLQIAAPMLLSINIAGLSFAGADVGGFFGNADSELMIRWMQAGSFTPFFRSHAHHDSRRREPWVFGEPTTGVLRKTIALRYSMLPYWYTTFAIAQREGIPVMRPLWMEFDAALESSEGGGGDILSIEDQWMVGSDIIVKPVTQPGQTSVDVYFPSTLPIHLSEDSSAIKKAVHSVWYDLTTYKVYDGYKKHYQNVASPLDKLPVFIRSGAIIPRKMRLRRSTSSMKNDPYTLIVSLDSSGSFASGSLYIDDGETFDYHKKGEYSIRKFTYENRELVSMKVDGKDDIKYEQEIERIVIVGLTGTMKIPKRAILSRTVGEPSQVDLEIVPISVGESSTSVYHIRKPKIKVNEDWKILLLDDI